MKNKAHVSPISTGLLIFGIVFAAMFPPLAVVFLMAAILTQQGYRRGKLADRRHAEAARAAQIAKARAAQLEMAYRIGSL
jgi:hypothetical protein